MYLNGILSFKLDPLSKHIVSTYFIENQFNYIQNSAHTLFFSYIRNALVMQTGNFYFCIDAV